MKPHVGACSLHALFTKPLLALPVRCGCSLLQAVSISQAATCDVRTGCAHAQAKFEQVARGCAAAEPAADADAAARAAFGLGESLQVRTTRSTGF